MQLTTGAEQTTPCDDVPRRCDPADAMTMDFIALEDDIFNPPAGLLLG